MSFLDTVEGEVALFRAVAQARPIGINRHFHMLTLRNTIHTETGRFLDVDEIWAKLETCYDMASLEAIDIDQEQWTDGPHAVLIPQPQPGENLSNHAFFREEYTLPHDDFIVNLLDAKRRRTTPSLPSNTPPLSPVLAPVLAPAKKVASRGGRPAKRVKNNNSAGLDSDSDSSVLSSVEDDADEGVPTPKDSVVTGTDPGTDWADEDNPELQDASPGPSSMKVPTKSKGKGSKKYNKKSTAASSSRPVKKKKK